MEIQDEDQVEIKKVIVSLDGINRNYSFEIDSSITYYSLKKIITAGAHLLKNSFTVFYGEQEYTKEYDDLTIKYLFEEINPIPLHIIKYESKLNELDKELTKKPINSNSFCMIHEKYELYYCYTCKKSICLDCLIQVHVNHNVEEKGNYLFPAKKIIDRIFANSSIDKQNFNISQYSNCIKYLSNLKFMSFNSIRQLLENLEMKFEKCLNFFSTSLLETEKNINNNLEVLKKFSVENLIQYKQNIKESDIIIKDKAFLAISKKVKDIDKLQKDYFKERLTKYKTLNNLYSSFIVIIDSILNDIEMIISKNLNRDIYENFEKDIEKYTEPKLQDESLKKLIIKIFEEIPNDSKNSPNDKENVNLIFSNDCNYRQSQENKNNNILPKYPYTFKEKTESFFNLSNNTIKDYPKSFFHNTDDQFVNGFEQNQISQFSNFKGNLYNNSRSSLLNSLNKNNDNHANIANMPKDIRMTDRKKNASNSINNDILK